MSELVATPSIDPRVALVLQGLSISADLHFVAGEPIAHETLSQRLQWDETLNAAVLPTGEQNEVGERLFHIFVVHSTHDAGEMLTPQLSFDERPEEYQTRVGNVYGTGLYTGNRREAVLRCREAEQGRRIGAYLTDVVTHSEVLDSRRRLVGDVAHLIGMVATEMVLPKIMGERKVAKKYADQHDAVMNAANKKVRLFNEAPRGRLEKLEHEAGWKYDTVAPQYLLSRVPMLRIGSFARPAETPKKFGIIAMYGKRFWQAAIRNGRDMKRLGVNS